VIGVIVPFSRPQMAENVCANLKRQRLPEPATLIVVENGLAIGSWDDVGHVVQSERGCTYARTAGLHKARELGCEWFAFWDDDDYYSPGFIEFMWQHRELADVVGLCRHMLETPAGYRFPVNYAASGPRLPEIDVGLLCGLAPGTMFGRTDRALDWDAHEVKFKAEIFWCTDMHRAGRTLWGLEEPNPKDPLYVLKRYADPSHGHAIPGDYLAVC
jgi:glycosyltransferase involved in cell wall biosynthesis